MGPVGYSLGLILVTTSAIAWSTAGLFTMLIPLDSWSMLAWRGIFGALGLAAVILAMDRRNALRGFRNLSRPGWLFASLGALGLLRRNADQSIPEVPRTTSTFGVGTADAKRNP